MNHTEEYGSEMKNEYLMDYHCGKAARTAQGLGLALLLTVLLLLAGCGGSSTTNSSPAPAKTSAPQGAATDPTFSTLTLSQAQQQAGYHLLSIPSSLTDYTLTKVTALGPSGHRLYNLFYSMGKKNITIVEGQSSGNQAGNSKVSLRGTTGTLISMNNGVIGLYWTENGVSRGIIGSLSSDQAIALAKALV
jgi:hypothetical protein